MAEQYLELGPGDRREVLEFAASESGRPAYLLEKDIWAVWTLWTLFDAPMGAPLVFKGGTSLSKAYGAIRRFSEDVDLTYDIRTLVPGLVGDDPHPLPANQSQEKRWTREIRERLAAWIRDAAAPFLAEALRAVEAHGEVRIENADLLVCYAPLNEGAPYVRPEVKLEFGARATGEPNAPMSVVCDAAPHVPDIEFPKAEPRVMQEELIGRHHDRKAFDCGDGALDEYLRRYARQNHESGGAKTFVAASSSEPARVLGYYTIGPGAVEFTRVPADLTRRLGRCDVPVFRLGQLAVDRTAQGQGLGGDLLLAASERALAVAAEVGGVALAIDAKSAEAARWYPRFGAKTLLDEPLKLILPLFVVADALASSG